MIRALRRLKDRVHRALKGHVLEFGPGETSARHLVGNGLPVLECAPEAMHRTGGRNKGTRTMGAACADPGGNGQAPRAGNPS
jgi:hypothetical protein